MASTSGRRVVVPLTNKSGGGVIAGDVVVIDTTNNDAFTTTTSAGFQGGVGIAQETIASNAVGRVLTGGYAALINTTASVTRGNFGTTSTTVKKAVDAGSSRVAGSFVQFLTGGTTPDGNVFNPDPFGAAGNMATDALWDAAGDLAQGTGANTGAKLSAGTAGRFLMSNGAAAALTYELPAVLAVAAVNKAASGGTSYATTMVDIVENSVTLAVTFTTPPSGKVIVRLAADGMDTGVPRYCLYDVGATAVVAGTYRNSATSGAMNTVLKEWYLSLTPNTSYTLRPQIKAGSGTLNLYSGPGSADGNFGPIVCTVTAAP